MTVTVSIKGQMVIPSQIRKKYNIQPQTKIELVDKGKEIVIIPIPKHPFRDSRGILKGKGISTADLIKFRREERRREQQKYKKYGISS